MNERLKKLSILTDYLVSELPECKGKENIISWLQSSPYSPYITLYGGENSLTYDESESFVSNLDNKKRYLLKDNFTFKLENFISHDDVVYSANTRLYDVINTQQLFKAYPDFKDIEVSVNISNSNNGNYSGSTYHSDNEVNRIEVFADNNENAMRVLLHELQHCVQLKEGFEIGESYYRNVSSSNISSSAAEKAICNILISLKEEELSYQEKNTYDVYLGKQEKTLLKIKDIEEIFEFSQGSRKEGAKKILSFHGDIAQTGGLTPKELVQISYMIANAEIKDDESFVLNEEKGWLRYRYDFDMKGVKFGILIEEDNFSKRIIDYYSDRNYIDYGNKKYNKKEERSITKQQSCSLLPLDEIISKNNIDVNIENSGVMDLFVGTTTNSNGDYLEGAFSDIATRKSMREIDDSGAEIHFTHGKNPFAYESFFRKPLGELLSHDELYLHYPFLKDVKVTVVEQSVLKNTLGIFSDGLILLNESLFLKGNEEELMDTLIHEIQHNIQEIENWSLGGNINDIKNEYSSISLKKDLLERKKSLIERNYELGSLLRKERFGTIETHEVSLLEMLKKETGYNDIQNNLIALDTQGELPHDKAFRMYQSLWGEQQARATSYRMQMSVQERMRESWTETLARVEGEYSEPIIKYGNSLMEARELEDIFLNEEDNINHKNIDLLSDSLPKRIKNYSDFEEQFNKDIIETPVGNVKINPRFAFSHLTKNSNGQNRFNISGAFVDTLKDPLFVVEMERDESPDNKVFYKAYKGKKGHWNLANFTIDGKGELKQKTFFSLNDNQLKRLIKVADEKLLYLNHSQVSKILDISKQESARSGENSATDENISTSLSQITQTASISNISLSEKEGDVKGKCEKDIIFDKKMRKKNFDEWFGDSKVVDDNGEPFGGYHVKNLDNEREKSLRFSESVVEESNCLESVSFGTGTDVHKGIDCTSGSRGDVIQVHNSFDRDIKKYSSVNPNILEKNDYDLRHIEKVLSILPNDIKTSTVKNYLSFNGITHEHLRGSIYQNCLDSEIFTNPVKIDKSVLDFESSYYQSPGEKESREIENLYITGSFDSYIVDMECKRLDELNAKEDSRVVSSFKV